MDKALKYILALLSTIGGFLFGDMEGMMIALIVLIVLDYITGLMGAYVTKTISSEVGAKGIAKIVFMLLIVAVANIVDINVIV